MNEATATADRLASPTETSHRSSPEKPDGRSNRHTNSRGVTIVMLIGALAFIACLILLAFSGGGDDRSQTVTSAPPSLDQPTEPNDEPAATEPSNQAVAPAEPTNEEPAPATTEATEPAAEPAAQATEPVTDEPTDEAVSPASSVDPAEPTTPDAEAVSEATPAISDTENQATEPTNPDAETVSEATPATSDTATEPAAQATEPTDAEPVGEAVVPSIEVDSPPVPPGAPDSRYSVLSGDKIFLRGEVPSAAIERQIVSAVEQVIGRGNVISEFIIDREAPFDPDAPSPVFINDAILFESGSTEINPDFLPLIATAPVLLSVQPTAVITITGYTDSSGSEATNLALSQQRVDAVRDWIIAQGGDGTRINAIGKGEADPVADNDTEAGRQANRRVEFLVEGFDFTLG